MHHYLQYWFQTSIYSRFFPYCWQYCTWTSLCQRAGRSESTWFHQIIMGQLVWQRTAAHISGKNVGWTHGRRAGRSHKSGLDANDLGHPTTRRVRQVLEWAHGCGEKSRWEFGLHSTSLEQCIRTRNSSWVEQQNVGGIEQKRAVCARSFGFPSN